jgi:hypothetical protein
VKPPLSSILLCTLTLWALALGACGGKLATTGCASVTQVDCNGIMRIQYPDGKAAWKRLDPNGGPKAVKLVEKHRFQPARIVETKNGSTLTFPKGDTVVYHDLP